MLCREELAARLEKLQSKLVSGGAAEQVALCHTFCPRIKPPVIPYLTEVTVGACSSLTVREPAHGQH